MNPQAATPERTYSLMQQNASPPPREAWTLSDGHAGNVRQALRLWIAAANVDPEDLGVMRVGPLDAMPAPLLEGLPLASKVLLAALLLHGPLHRSELSAVTLGQGKELDAEVIHLVHLGLVVLDARDESRSRADPLVRVRTRMIAPLTWELRACNLL